MKTNKTIKKLDKLFDAVFYLHQNDAENAIEYYAFEAVCQKIMNVKESLLSEEITAHTVNLLEEVNDIYIYYKEWLEEYRKLNNIPDTWGL